MISMTVRTFDPHILQELHQPDSDSHKGQNGKLLVIGGSKLFHASIFWSAEVAAKIVDLVHFSSPAMENNDLVRQKIKGGFWSGIVVPWEEVENYITEDDCVLIGPGMPREEGLQAGEVPTREIVDGLLQKFPDKKWVVDGGALQEVEPMLLNGNMIVTPHQGEFARLTSKMQDPRFMIQEWDNLEERAEKVRSLSHQYGGLTVISKGKVDVVGKNDECVRVEGGNAGLTKGGTGDVLAGLTAALYCTNNAILSAQVASYVNKKAGEKLAERVGNYYAAGDLVQMAPMVLYEMKDN